MSSSHPTVNLVDVLARRQDAGSSSATGSSTAQHRQRLEALLEHSFTHSHEHFDYELSPDMVLSTIAIAISADGALVASTHGDHTVKIFQHDTGKFIHSFQGHPRTPWTVKFHPTDANYVASGCLGCEVRVWDIRNRMCRSFIRLGYSIISLSFQPNNGAHIGIASGPQLLLWDWRRSSTPEEDDVMYRKGTGDSQGGRGLNQNQIVYPNQEIEPVLVHSRNIRAVIFHPLGTLAFAAAPDPPRQANAAPSPCRLYSFNCPLTGNRNNVQRLPAGEAYIPPALDTMPTLIPQIHLYSDGGLDISADGRFIFTCAMLATKKAPHALAASHSSCHTRTPPVPVYPPPCPRHSSHNSTCSSDSAFSSVTADETDSDDDSTRDIDQRRTRIQESSELNTLEASLSSLRLHDSGTSRGRTPGDGRILPVVGTHRLSDFFTGSLQLNPLPSAASLASPPEETVFGLGSFFSHGRSVVLPEAVVAAVVTDGSYMMFLADPLSTPYPADWSVEERLCLFKISVHVEENSSRSVDMLRSGIVTAQGKAINDPKTVTTIGSFSVHGTDTDVGLKKDDGALRDPYAVPHSGDKKQELPVSESDRIDESTRSRISEAVEGDEVVSMCPRFPPRVDLVQSKHLPGSLMRAVTSMKLSPSGRLGLIGYGVRVNDNVIHHPNKKVACEILDLTNRMSTSCLMTDNVDEVNIAQFHPIPGSGVLYGTKRGKVRVFCTKKLK